MNLPPFISRDEVGRRLLLIFPEGTPNRTYCTRKSAASTVFVMLYVGAIEDLGQYLGPKYVYRMSDEQAALTSDAARIEYANEMNLSGSRSWWRFSHRDS